MKHRASRRATMLAPIAAAFASGIVAGWLLHAWGPPGPHEPVTPVEASIAAEPEPVPHAFEPASGPADASAMRAESPASARPSAPLDARELPLIPPSGDNGGDAVDVLRTRHLRLPIDGAKFDSLKGNFSEKRSGGGGHTHEAVDILAPRHTAIHAVEAGTIAKLFDSKAGGHTVYQFDPEQRFAYYYAHLDRYADGLREGQRVSEGDVIGYVGTSGNAPPETPHLHFTIFELGPEKRWWQGRPLDPYLVFRR